MKKSSIPFYLVMDKSELSSRLLKQIERGRAIRNGVDLILDSNEKESYSASFRIWNEYNKELIRRAFNTEDNKILEDLHAALGQVINSNIQNKETDLTLTHHLIDKTVEELTGLRDRLELLPTGNHTAQLEKIISDLDNELARRGEVFYKGVVVGMILSALLGLTGYFILKYAFQGDPL